MATTTSLAVKVESFTSISSLPPAVATIYHICGIQLPSWCFSGPYKLASDKLMPLSSELADSSTTLCDDSHNHPQNCLSEIFNTSLSVVADIRCLIEIYGPSRSALPFVCSLFRVLAQMCARESITITDTPFVRPRKPGSGHEFDGVATMLACHIVTAPPRESSSPMDFSDHSSTSLLSLRYPMSRDSRSHCGDTEVAFLDLPLEAHVIPGRGRQLSAALPFLCIASSDNVADLMASVACQRYIWGNPQPVVGFVLSETGVLARLVVSWVDAATHVIHIALPAAPDLGVFNFTNPTSTLRFSQFILNLSPHFVIIAEHSTASFQNNRLDWRSDTVEILSEKPGSWKDHVAQWIRDAETQGSMLPSHVINHSPRTRECPLSPPPTPPSSPPSADEPPRKTYRFPFLRPSNSSLASDPRTMPSGPSTCESESHQSSSDCAPISSQRSSETRWTDTVTWALTRGILLVGRISFDQSTAEDEEMEFNERLSSYDKMCRFLWSPSWGPESCPVDDCLLQSRNSLFQQMGDLIPTEDSDLKPAHRELLQERMSALLYASAGAGSFTLQMRRSGIRDVGNRHHWDALLYHFYVQEGEDISPYVLLQQTIHLPRNNLADELDAESLVKKHYKQLQKNQSFCSDAHQAAEHLGPASAISQQALDVSIEATNFLYEFLSILKSPEEVKGFVERRSRQEAPHGQCGTLLCGAIKNTSIDSAEFIVQSPSTSPTSSRFDTTSFQNPFHLCTTESETFGKSMAGSHRTDVSANQLLLPHFVAEHQKPCQNEGKALEDGRMHLASIVAFYSALGIDDYPFYALVTCGTIGSVLVAWKSATHKQTYLVEHNVQKFDISIPIETFHFTSFLLRLRDDQAKLKKCVEGKLREGVDQARLREWTKYAQINDTSRDPDA